MGAPLDPYFHLPLWLQVNCLGKTLWAYNERHLDELDRYVRVLVRERTPNVNRSVASRLPAWIKKRQKPRADRALHQRSTPASVERARSTAAARLIDTKIIPGESMGMVWRHLG